MRTLLDSAEPKAQFAVELFVYRIGRELGSHAAALGGLDALVFTAGIGESCAWLGVEIDPGANARKAPRISSAQSRVSAWVIPTNEELMIARHTGRLLGLTPARA
jgi:acetate kinase